MAIKKQRSALNSVVTREYTINLRKKVQRRGQYKQAPRAVKAIREFARRAMGTEDVRLDPFLNKAVFKDGIHKAPLQIRVRISRKRNETEGAKEKLYSLVQAVNVASSKGLETVVIEDDDEE